MALYAIVLCISIVRLPLYIKTPLKILPIVFFITVLTEFKGFYIIGDKPYDNTIHNIYNLLFFLLFYYIYLQTVASKLFKLLIKCALAIVMIPFLWECFNVDIVLGSFFITYIVGACLLVMCIILYFITILQSSKILVVKQDLLFWISIGLFLFYIGYLPIKVMRSMSYASTDFFNLLFLIQSCLIIVMYFCFLIGFLWMRKRS